MIPCIDEYRKVDLRVVSFQVPPQEVSVHLKFIVLSYPKEENEKPMEPVFFLQDLLPAKP